MTLVLRAVLIGLIAGVCNAAAELKVIEAYKGVKFPSHSSLQSDLVSTFLLNALGITDKKVTGLKYRHTSPFSYAGGLVIMEASRDIFPNIKPITTVEVEGGVDDWDKLRRNVTIEMHKKLLNKAVTVNAFGESPDHGNTALKYLNTSKTKDQELLKQVETINQLSSQLPLDGVKTMVWIDGDYLSDIAVEYGQNSLQMLEATELFSEAVERIVNQLRDIYFKKVLNVLIIKDEDVRGRKVRSLLQIDAEPSAAANRTAIKNLAYESSDDFAIIFNIVLWLSIVLVIALIAISYGIGYMDPGRDSIIYRMTSQRMKKEQ